MTKQEIFASYSPYDRFPEFQEGFDAYGKTYDNPYNAPQFKGYQAQAWDRGLEAASRVAGKNWLNV